MKNSAQILRYGVALLVVLIAGALIGWYFVLHSAQKQTDATVTARGLGTALPTPGNALGSTYQNIVSLFGGGSGTTTPGRLWHASPAPVAGADFVGTSSTLYFVSRSTGSVFSAIPQSGAVTRLTDTLFPKVYEASIGPKGTVFMRMLNDAGQVITYVAKVSSSATSTDNTSGTLSGQYLAPGITALTVNTATDTIFYTAQDSSGNTAGIIANFDGTKQKKVFTLNLSNWRLFYLSDGREILAQKASDGASGYAFQIQKDGSFTTLVQGPGLTVLPNPSSGALLYGTSNGSLTLYTKVSAAIASVPSPIHTIADKCVWAPGQSLIAYCAVPTSIPSQTFLDNWYKGITHTADEWWQINASNGVASLLYSPIQDKNLSLDVVDPSIDPTGNYISFINGADGSLWVLRIQK